MKRDENPPRKRRMKELLSRMLFLETLDYLMRWGIAKLPTVETLLNSSFPIRNPLSTTCFIFMQLLIKQLEYARGAPAAEENNSQMNLNFGGVLQWNLEWLKKVQYYDLSVGVTSCRFDMVCMQLFRWKKIKESRLSRRWCALLLLLFASISSFFLSLLIMMMIGREEELLMRCQRLCTLQTLVANLSSTFEWGQKKSWMWQKIGTKLNSSSCFSEEREA